jgi:pimeloyl-ACP methyl ester carboxylesterase
VHVTVNGVRLFFDVMNPKLEIVPDGLKDKPTLVCLPGGPGGDHQTLRPFVDRFANVAQVVYLDHRASGRSERGDPATWTLDQWGDDVAAFCEALGIVKPLVLGVSGGAIVTQAYLTRHPDHAGGAILINPCARMVRDVVIAGFEKLGGPKAGAAARAMYTRGARRMCLHSSSIARRSTRTHATSLPSRHRVRGQPSTCRSASTSFTKAAKPFALTTVRG